MRLLAQILNNLVPFLFYTKLTVLTPKLLNNDNNTFMAKGFNRFRLKKDENGLFILPLRGLHPSRVNKIIKTRIWKTPDTYDLNFSLLPERCGVYVLRVTDLDTLEQDIVYVGSTFNLHQRLHYKGHLVYSFINSKCAGRLHIVRLFLETENYLEVEKRLIKHFNPLFNVTYNVA